MNQKYDKLKNLLKELFQLDQPDLDFGLYRIMHARSAGVSHFLDDDLLPQGQAAFGQYKSADKAEIEKELARVIASIETVGMDLEQDNLVLDEWFTRQGYFARDSEFDLIYVNGGNDLENLKTPDDLWKVRLIEEDFHRLMFETEGA
jgi:hypothetical protein